MKIFIWFLTQSHRDYFFETFILLFQDIPTISVSPKVPDVPVVKPADRPKKNRLFMRSKSKDDETGGTRERRQKYRKKHVKKQNSTPIPGRVIRQNTHDSDNDENSKQFLKLDVKYITDGEVRTPPPMLRVGGIRDDNSPGGGAVAGQIKMPGKWDESLKKKKFLSHSGAEITDNISSVILGVVSFVSSFARIIFSCLECL